MSGRRIFHFFIALSAAMLLQPATSIARDDLEAIVRKDTLNNSDLATIETVVNQRVKRFNEASNNAKQRREARDALIATAKVSKASQAGLDAYAEACAGPLVGAVTSDKLQVGLEAVQILIELNNPRALDALCSALGSSHAAVRYRAAIGVRALHSRIAGDRGLARTALSALGNAGSSEENEHVLRAIYEAIDFKSGVAAFQFSDDSAAALLDVWQGRLAQLRRGSRDEWKDVSGFECAGRNFSDASNSHKAELVAALFEFLKIMAARYDSADSASDYIPTLRDAAKSLEQSLEQILRSASVDSPSNAVSGKMADKRTDSSQKAVQEGLEAWRAALNKSPWPLR